MRRAVESLRALTPEERDSFTVDRLRVVEAQDGETLAALSKRTENILLPRVTGILNGLSPTVPLTTGQLVKIVRRTRYRPREAGS